MSALASLTANYSDSDDEVTASSQRKRNKMSVANEAPPPPSTHVETQQRIPNSAAAVNGGLPQNDNGSKLVSYCEDNDIVVSDEEMGELPNVDEEDILPPEPPGRCSKELQDKIARLHDRIVKEGVDMNCLIQNRKDFRNPSIYEKLLQFCNINELGTNYPPQLYDPQRWGKESYYEELGRLQRNDLERRQKERKERTKIEIVSGMKKASVSHAIRKLSDKKSKWDLTKSATGTKGTVISAFGSLPKKQNLNFR